MKVPQGVQKRQSQQQLLDIIGEHCLTQVVDIPTRNDKTLDLLFTNFPSPVNRVKGMPPIGKADHDIVYVEYDIKAKRLKQASRKIYLYKRADMVGLKDHMTQFKDAYLSEDHSHMSVNDMWVKFKTGFVEAVERFIPSKMTKTKYSVPWIDLTIKRLVKKRNKLYLRARKSKDPDVKIHYKRFRAHVQKVLRDAYWKYVSNIFTFENDSSDPDTPKPEKIKKFWSFVKSLKKDACGIASLRENGILKTDTKEKANICNRQFQSAFTREGDSDSGITISDNMDWGQHISEISSKATKTLGFLRRNLAFAPRSTKEVAYKTLVRPKLEYAAPIWSPYSKLQINQVEKVQRTAACWTCRRWRNTSSVGEMLDELEWPSLEARRDQSSLLLFNKIHSGAVSIEKDKYLTPARSLKSTRSSHSAQYCRYQTYSDALKNSFFPRTIPQWNSLSPLAVNSQTAEEFRALLI